MAARAMWKGVIRFGEVSSEPNAEPEQDCEVIDLMQVLKQSLAEGRPPGQEERNDRTKGKASAGGGKSPSGDKTKAKRSTGEKASSRSDSKAATQGKHRPTELERLSRDELYERAKRLNVPGRSRMSKAELVEAIANTN